MKKLSSKQLVYSLVLFSGMAALSWEVLWQNKATLALGVSAWGTSLTLAITMGGLSIGSFFMGRYLKDKTFERPARTYAILEWIIGIAGLFVLSAFALVERIDSWVYGISPEARTWIDGQKIGHIHCCSLWLEYSWRGGWNDHCRVYSYPCTWNFWRYYACGHCKYHCRYRRVEFETK